MRRPVRCGNNRTSGFGCWYLGLMNWHHFSADDGARLPPDYQAWSVPAVHSESVAGAGPLDAPEDRWGNGRLRGTYRRRSRPPEQAAGKRPQVGSEVNSTLRPCRLAGGQSNAGWAPARALRLTRRLYLPSRQASISRVSWLASFEKLWPRPNAAAASAFLPFLAMVINDAAALWTWAWTPIVVSQ